MLWASKDDLRAWALIAFTITYIAIFCKARQTGKGEVFSFRFGIWNIIAIWNWCDLCLISRNMICFLNESIVWNASSRGRKILEQDANDATRLIKANWPLWAITPSASYQKLQNSFYRFVKSKKSYCCNDMDASDILQIRFLIFNGMQYRIRRVPVSLKACSKKSWIMTEKMEYARGRDEVTEVGKHYSFLVCQFLWMARLLSNNTGKGFSIWLPVRTRLLPGDRLQLPLPPYFRCQSLPQPSQLTLRHYHHCK